MPSYILKCRPCKTLKSPLEEFASLLTIRNAPTRPAVGEEMGKIGNDYLHTFVVYMFVHCKKMLIILQACVSGALAIIFPAASIKIQQSLTSHWGNPQLPQHTLSRYRTTITVNLRLNFSAPSSSGQPIDAFSSTVSKLPQTPKTLNFSRKTKR